MPSSFRKPSPINIYHVIYRGINKQRIFEVDEDYSRFLEMLRKYKPKCGYKIIAYCLMSNHIHLLIKVDEMELGRIFQNIMPSFVCWYNIKYQRIGHLFQSRFKSQPVNNESQLLTVIRYIHQNPVKAAICSEPERYPYSSFRDYFDNDLIDSELVSSLVSREYFWSFNHAENSDQCMDIEEERPRVWSDERAVEIMQKVIGCSSVAAFQKLSIDKRDEALRAMHKMGISVKQANRITGVPKGTIRRVIA